MKRQKQPSVLIVLSRLPDDLSFFTSKFVGVGQYLNTDILSWDTAGNKRNYEIILRKNGFKGKIYLAPINFSMLALVAFLGRNVPFILLNPRRVYKFLSTGYRAYGLDIFKRLFFNFFFLRSKHSIWHFEFGATSPWYSYLKDLFPHKKLTVSFRGYDLNYVGLADTNYYQPTWEKFDAFHFLGQDLSDRAIKRGYKPKNFDRLIPPAIDATFFQPSGTQKTIGEKLIIVSTGRLVWKKGFDYGIRAAAILKSKGIAFEYRIIGDGDYLQALQFTIAELGLQHDVKLMGRMNKEQVKKQLQEADVFFHPAISEGFCNAVLEAQAMGVPVVCTDADGLPENVVNNETGFVVPKWDVSAMADKLEWIYYNRDKATLLGANGVKRVADKFKIDDQVKAFVEFYRNVHAG